MTVWPCYVSTYRVMVEKSVNLHECRGLGAMERKIQFEVSSINESSMEDDLGQI